MSLNQTSQALKTFTGGVLETNAYLIPCPKGNLLVDAPEGSAAAFRETPVSLLFLTHGHYDHVWDAAEIVRQHGCAVAMHPVTEQMLADKPELKVVFMSGYPGEMSERGLHLDGGPKFLQKPFAPSKLAQTVRECLDAV